MAYIPFDWAATVGLVCITAIETLAGILGCIGLYKMWQARNKPYKKFIVGKMYMIGGCVAAIMVWGVGFMVIGGDWFLSWQSKAGFNMQLGAMIYVLPCFLALIVAAVHTEK